MDADQIDVIVHELYLQASAEFDCRTCANCCKGVSPLLDEEDVERLSKRLDLPAECLISTYLVKDVEYDAFIFNRKPCPFLKDNLCTCYDSRPHDCVSYPHLHKDRFVSRLSNMVANCSVCPIVYTVYEGLKAEIKLRQK